MSHIIIPDCEPRHLYVVDARNFSLAVYRGGGVFIGVRNKFGCRYLDEEDHWDTGAPHGTVKPLRDLGEVPADLNVSLRSPELLETLQRPSLLVFVERYGNS
jgi:hypothetical protein